jgi:LAS superfamily LD-carboxypeptidase LdcB
MILWAMVPNSTGAIEAPADVPTTPTAVRWSDDPTADLVEVQARFDESVRVVEEAERELRDSVAKEMSASEQIGRLDVELERLAVDEYMDGDTLHSAVSVILVEPNSGVKRQALVTAVAGDRTEVIKELKAAKELLLQARPEAEAAIERAKVHRAEMSMQLETLKAAQERVAAMGKRFEVGRGMHPVGSGNLINVRGIVVDATIADSLNALLEAAERDGIILGGGGYRDPAAQRRLRRQNCPSANSPPSACSPPTARPGSSLHEQGLAIDFTYNGTTINSRSSPASRWLTANAKNYGLYNLPSEPWHYSVNGN